MIDAPFASCFLLTNSQLTELTTFQSFVFNVVLTGMVICVALLSRLFVSWVDSISKTEVISLSLSLHDIFAVHKMDNNSEAIIFLIIMNEEAGLKH